MIKINLLPHKKVKPVEKGILKLRAAIIVLSVILLVGLGVWYFLLSGKINDLKQKSLETTKQLESLKAKIKEVEGYEKSRLAFEKKLGVIKELQDRRLPLTPVLDDINKAMIKEAWLTGITVLDGSLTIDAVAKEDRKNADVFMERLKGSPLFKDVAVSELKEVPSNSPGVKTFSFRVTGKLAGYIPKPVQPEGAPASSGKNKAQPGKGAPAPTGVKGSK